MLTMSCCAQRLYHVGIQNECFNKRQLVLTKKKNTIIF